MSQTRNETAQLAMDLAFAQEGTTVRLSGSADTRSKDELQQFLLRSHDQIHQKPSRHVTVDIRGLDFMSSSCIKAFVTWLVTIQAMPREARYPIHFLYDRQRSWQKRTLMALSCFACELVGLTEG